MNYNTVVNEALEAIPEFRDEYNTMIKEDYIDNESGPHTVFGYAFTPLLKKAIRKNKKLAQKMFDFLERMSTSGDIHTQEVCDQSVIEALVDDFTRAELYKFMGPSTKEGLEAVSMYMRVK